MEQIEHARQCAIVLTASLRALGFQPNAWPSFKN